MARIGAGTTAHAVAPPVTGAWAPPPAAPRAHAVTAPCAPARGGDAVARATVRSAQAVPRPPVVRAAPLVMTTPGRAGGGTRIRPATRRVRPPVAAVCAAPRPSRPRARPAGARCAVALRAQRRERVPWKLLGRGRLRAAWEAVRAVAGEGEEAALVGVYGPLPLGAVADVALEPDGRLVVSLAAVPVRREPMGDVAVGRVGADRRLVRCDLPYPGGVRRSRPAR